MAKNWQEALENNKYLMTENNKKIAKEQIENLIRENNLSEDGAKELAYWATYHPMFMVIYWSPNKVAEATKIYTGTYIQKLCKDGILDTDRNTFAEYLLTHNHIKQLYARKNKE